MSEIFHRTLTVGELHIPFRKVFADILSVASDVGPYDAADLGALALVQDQGDGHPLLLTLTATTPVWQLLWADTLILAAQGHNTPIDLRRGFSQFWTTVPSDDVTYPDTWTVAQASRSLYISLPMSRLPKKIWVRLIDVNNVNGGAILRLLRKTPSLNTYLPLNTTGSPTDLQTVSAGSGNSQTIILDLEAASVLSNNFPSLLQLHVQSGTQAGTYRLLTIYPEF